MREPSNLVRSQYPKLVRDYMPIIIRREGATPQFRKLTGADKVQALMDKLHEEVHELEEALSSGRTDQMTEEFADVFEVLTELVYSSGTYMSSVNEYRDQKGAIKGRFSDGIYMEGVEIDE